MYIRLDMYDSNIFYCRSNATLSSTNKTRYKLEQAEVREFKSFDRYFMPIAMTLQLSHKPFLNEFDTVGMVAKLRIDALSQDVWLTDYAGR